MNALTIDDRPLFSLTAGEFLELLQHAEKPLTIDTTPGKTGKEYVYGLKGIAEIFGCSVTTANAIKKGGKINKAITQLGRKIIVDKALALELFKLQRTK